MATETTTPLPPNQQPPISEPRAMAPQTWESGGGRRIVLAFAFLLLLPFYASLGPMLYQRASRGFVGDTILLALFALAFTAVMALILQQLVHAVRTRVSLTSSGVSATVPRVGARGPFFLLGYDSREIAYADIAGVDQRNEVYGGSLAPVLLTSTRIVPKSGAPLVLGYTNANDTAAQLPFPEMGREIAARAGVEVKDHGTVHRSLAKRVSGIASTVEETTPLSAADVATLNSAHKRNIRVLVAGLALLVVAGIVIDVATAERTGYAELGAAQPAAKGAPKKR